MRVLLDTNIVIYRESSRPERQDIGILFKWLDKLHYEKCIHPETANEIHNHKDAMVVKAFETKISNYCQLHTLAPENDNIINIREKYDRGKNDYTDTAILNEVYSGRVGALITEDRIIHRKASELGISERVYTIDTFLEKVTAEYPDLSDYKVLSVRKEYFGNIDLNDSFFDSFRDDYTEFNKWFVKKSDEIAYVCRSDVGEIVAFLFVKIERENENYSDVEPIFHPAKRLKIGTLKVVSNGFKLGERFLKIIFDNALKNSVEEIYVTLFNNTLEQNRLKALLEDWGFEEYGVKKTMNGKEIILVREFKPTVDINNPCYTCPYISMTAKKFIVPIYPEYHTELFPDSILRTESPLDFVENRPNRNAISKIYISRSVERNLNSGDIIVFYRTRSGGSGYHTSVITTIGIVQNINANIQSESQFIELCRQRSVFSDQELRAHWNYNRNNRPFIVNFLYVYSLPRRMNLRELIDAGVIMSVNTVPRGFEQISNTQFNSILEGSNADRRFIVN